MFGKFVFYDFILLFVCVCAASVQILTEEDLQSFYVENTDASYISNKPKESPGLLVVMLML